MEFWKIVERKKSIDKLVKQYSDICDYLEKRKYFNQAVNKKYFQIQEISNWNVSAKLEIK